MMFREEDSDDQQTGNMEEGLYQTCIYSYISMNVYLMGLNVLTIAKYV